MIGFNDNKKKSKRIALINSEGLSVFVLQKHTLVHDAWFSDEDVGYENFRYYLAEAAPTPITLVVDSVAEDFLADSLPHVSIYDRKGFLNRKCDQHFRGLEYRSANVVGRDKTGRKNDKVLFSALTKNQILDPWVRVLLQMEIPVQSITTPPFALVKVAQKHELLTSKAVLLVNWEASGIRQTFIINEKMMFSRLSQVQAGPDEDLAGQIIESCNQSKDYLERIGLLAFDQPLDLHIITPQLQDADFLPYSESRYFASVHHHNSVAMLGTEYFNGPEQSMTAVLLCLDWGVRDGLLANQYAPPPVLRFYELGQVRKYLGLFCLGAMIASAGVSLPLLLDALERRDRAAGLRADILPIQSQYDALTSQFPETPIPFETMELAVSNHDLILSQARNPVEIMRLVSEVIGRRPAIVLNSMEWRLNGAQENSVLTSALLEGSTSISLDLFGILMGSGSIGDSDRELRAFIAALNNIAGATAVPISLPIESGPDGAVSTVIDGEAVDVEFAISVRMEG